VNIKILLYIPLLVMTPVLTQAGPILITGTPADDSSLPNTAVSPKIGGLVNFDSLPSCATFPPVAPCTNYSGTNFSGITISSPDGLYAIPYSAQSGPNELFDNSAQGSANILVNITGGVTAMGVGIADSDAASIFLQPLGASLANLGPAFLLSIPETGPNPGNGYFVIQDTTPDIFGFRITQSVGDPSFSGLAIDDVQVAPEPSTLLLLSAGVIMFGALRLRKRA
jgi:hypothetical protein